MLCINTYLESKTSLMCFFRSHTAFLVLLLFKYAHKCARRKWLCGRIYILAPVFMTSLITMTSLSRFDVWGQSDPFRKYSIIWWRCKNVARKHFTQNTRALRLVAEELLRNIISTMEPSQGYDDLMLILDSRSEQSMTTGMWVDNLFLSWCCLLGLREADWPLHLQAVRQVMPYFFSAGHFNYAR
jgi:hypothetical protein